MLILWDFFTLYLAFKFLDYKGFPNSFRMYDPLAKQFPIYAWCYPFIETVLGIMFLLRIKIKWALVITILILGITTFGVIKTLLKNNTMCLFGNCPKLPTTEATLIENAVMITAGIGDVVNLYLTAFLYNMVTRKTALKIRKTHRYLGLFLGNSISVWTISGLYFSWTNIDDIHGDQFKNFNYENISFNNLISPDSLDVSTGINQVVLRDIAGEPYYWINNSQLYHARTALLKEVSHQMRRYKLHKHMKPNLVVDHVSN